MRNAIGREVPGEVEGYRVVAPFAGARIDAGEVTRAPVTLRSAIPGRAKVLADLGAALEACELRDGATLSFHHHLRNGDGVLNAVLDEIARLGRRDMRVAVSSLFPVHEPLVRYIEQGVVTGIVTGYAAGPVGEAIARGALATAAIMQTHGGRARAIESGDLAVDIAFVAAPTADACGNVNGMHGKTACGTLGYAIADAAYARHVVAVTDNLVPYPACPIVISQDQVDHVVVLDSIGDARGIVSGTTRMTTDPVRLEIAHTAARVIDGSGLLADGFSFQTGAGGVSLAVAACVREIMAERRITGSFAAGGITGYLVEMLEAGLFRALFDVQCFDLEAVASYRRNPAHQAMSASMYGNPHNRGAVCEQLDVAVMGAAEIDLEFNVNVTTGSGGLIMGGSGGHSDIAAGAKLAMVTTQLTGGGYAKVVDAVTVVTTPGESIDVLVTDAGVAVNPRRADLAERLAGAGLPVVSIEELRAKAEGLATRGRSAPEGGRTVAVIEYRDGTLIDTVKEVRGD